MATGKNKPLCWESKQTVEARRPDWRALKPPEVGELVAGASCAWLRSKTVKKSIDPEFNQVFLLEVPLNEEQFLPGAANLQLHLRVYDWDRGTADDYLGACGYNRPCARINIELNISHAWFKMAD